MLKRTSLQSEIIEYIQEYISTNNLEEGDRLPSQHELKEMLGVSRVSLREAIKTLEAKGVLEVLNGKGIYVLNPIPNVISAEIEFKREKESILELLEVRRMFEKEIIRLFIENATDEEVKDLGEILAVLMEKYRNGQKQNVEDKMFHDKIYKYSHNRILYGLLLSIDNLLENLWNFPLGLEDPFTDTIPLHEELYWALRDRDLKKARRINGKILDNICLEVKRAEL